MRIKKPKAPKKNEIANIKKNRKYAKKMIAYDSEMLTVLKSCKRSKRSTQGTYVSRVRPGNRRERNYSRLIDLKETRYYKKPNSIMRLGYCYTLQWIETKTFKEMWEVACELERIKKISVECCPFNLALRMLFTDIELETGTRSEYALSLQYAYLHNVPPHFLAGFIHQIGGPVNAAKKLKNKQFEHWLNDEYEEDRLAKFIFISDSDLEKIKAKKLEYL